MGHPDAARKLACLAVIGGLVGASAWLRPASRVEGGAARPGLRALITSRAVPSAAGAAVDAAPVVARAVVVAAVVGSSVPSDTIRGKGNTQAEPRSAAVPGASAAGAVALAADSGKLAGSPGGLAAGPGAVPTGSPAFAASRAALAANPALLAVSPAASRSAAVLAALEASQGHGPAALERAAGHGPAAKHLHRGLMPVLESSPLLVASSLPSLTAAPGVAPPQNDMSTFGLASTGATVGRALATAGRQTGEAFRTARRAFRGVF